MKRGFLVTKMPRFLASGKVIVDHEELEAGPRYSAGGRTVSSKRWFKPYCLGAIVAVLVLVGICGLVLATWNSSDAEKPTGDGMRALLHIPDNNPPLPSSNTKPRYKKHIVELYYEVLCPFSRDFMIQQFLPTYFKLRMYIQPVLIPYGKANTTTSEQGQISFECQHGPAECNGNMIHACAIHYAPSTGDPTLLQYLGCMIKDNSDPGKVGKKCAEELFIDWEPIRTCWQKSQGPELLKAMGEETRALVPRLIHVPTVTIDGSQDHQDEMLEDFHGYICNQVLIGEKPVECS